MGIFFALCLNDDAWGAIKYLEAEKLSRVSVRAKAQVFDR